VGRRGRSFIRKERNRGRERRKRLAHEASPIISVAPGVRRISRNMREEGWKWE